MCVDHMLLEELLCEEVDAARCLGTGDVLTSELLLDVSFQNISQFSPVLLVLYFNTMDIFQVFSGMAVDLENSAAFFAINFICDIFSYRVFIKYCFFFQSF